jgi:Holliday junction DNA helicase RuvA
VIAYLEGTLREKQPTRVVLDVHGVGYEVLIPLSTFYDLPEEGKTIALRIHTHVREDALQLFGFRTARERSVFELLLRTSGVGPKLAQALLSGLAPDDLLGAIRDGKAAVLRSVPGVGQKTAERIVIDLRDRVGTLIAEASAEGGEPQAAGAAPAEPGSDDEALSALVNLGYPRAHAERVIEAARGELGPDAPLERVIRAARRRLSR